MNLQTYEALSDYGQACKAINEAFAAKYFTDEEGNIEEWYCVADKQDAVMGIGDWFFSMEDRIQALENNIPWEVLSNWYDESLQKYVPCTSKCEARKAKKRVSNLKNFYLLSKNPTP